MTRNELMTAIDHDATRIERAYQAAQNSGAGEPAEDVDLGERIVRAETDRDLSIYLTDGGRVWAVGDVNGPWAIDITDALAS